MSAEQLIQRTGANPGRARRLQDDLQDMAEGYGAFASSGAVFALKPGVDGFWRRVLWAALTVAEHVFDPKGKHPLSFQKGGAEVWITAADCDYLVLVFIQAITRLAWAKGILPIGLIKDTNAFELVKAAVPIMEASGLFKASNPLPNFSSDKMLLQTNSVVNAADVPTPWHTVEIDAAFRTMAPVRPQQKAGEVWVNGAYGNVIYPERVYVKAYFQLWRSEASPDVRSHVFTFDRPAYPQFDHWDEVLLLNRDGGVDEEVHPILHYRKGSRMTNLAMALLAEMGKEVIPEALGHNYPLFLADKKAKAVLAETKEAYMSAVELEIAKSELDQQVLFSRRFRDYRSKIEGTRRS
ncbi:MAG: hypothetical protein HY297_04170 [Thaumarchaeota archaeon]|nr:hypothetical protein [Nitrososphaerota archaeon]